MQATGRERGDRKKAVQPTLLHRGSTILTLFDLIAGIQIAPQFWEQGGRLWDKKKMAFFFFFAFWYFFVFVLNTCNETWSV